jgi:hypothetical protein
MSRVDGIRLNASTNFRGLPQHYQIRVSAAQVDAFKRLQAAKPDLLQRLGEHALSRGVSVINITEPQIKFQFTRVTCRSMTIPIQLLEYVLKEELPLGNLEQPDPPIGIDIDWDVSGDGVVLALRGSFIGQGVRFQTATGRPIILRENSTIEGTQLITAGTIVGPGERRVV